MKLLILVLISVVALMLVVMPNRQEVVVKVPLPLERVMQEFEQDSMRNQWYTPANGIPYSLTKANPFEFVFVHAVDQDSLPLHVVVSPDTSDSKITKIVYRYESQSFSSKQNELKKNLGNSLEQLGELLKSNRYVYGYNIELTTVVDSSFLFLSKVVKADKEAEEAKKIFDELIAYAKLRNADYNGVRIYYTQKQGPDRLAIYASIGVNTYTPTAPSDPIQYKMMPYGKKLLVMDVEVPFGKTKDLFSVLEQYKQHHTLVSMAIPFQKFLSPGYGFADSQVVKTRISYPVF
jgi:hypothetical protein